MLINHIVFYLKVTKLYQNLQELVYLMTAIVSPKNGVETKPFQYMKLILQFRSNLQKGDVGIDQNIQNGIVLYGQTKTGKTTAGHVLSCNPLKGQHKDGEYIVQQTTSRNRKAEIGNTNTAASQTLIPNFFQVKLKNGKYSNSKTYVIDTPGYGDSKGVLTILSNGYYHYRLYLKVKNMKFVLCFEKNHLSNTADKFIDTIVQFTSYFKDYQEDESVQKQIWKSCAFLITKVQETTDTLEDLEKKLLKLVSNLKTQLLEKKEKVLKNFIRFILKQKRIFYIPQARVGQPIQCKGLLEKIDEKIQKWYQRNIIDGQIDMASISFSLARQIILESTRNQKSKQQYGELVRFYREKIRQTFEKVTLEELGNKQNNSLDYVLKKLVNDAMGAPQSHQFLEVMKSYVQKNYNNFENSYKEERQKKQRQLFQTKMSLSQTTIQQTKPNKINSRSYIVKKFEALQAIAKFKSEINDRPFTRDLKWLNECQQQIFNIIKQFNKISFKRSKCSEIIYKYGYIIYRLIEQAKVFTLLIQVSANQKQRIAINTDFGNFDLSRTAKDFMACDFYYKNQPVKSCKNLQTQFIKKFDIDGNGMKKLAINQSLIDFFSSANIENKDLDIIKKIINLVLRYSDQVLTQSQHKLILVDGEKQRLIKRLTDARKKCEKVFFESTNPDQKTQIALILRQVTENLGNILELDSKFELARRVYETIRFVQNVCQMYDYQIDAKPNDVNIRINYSNYMSEHFREHDALKLMQKTYQIAKTTEDLGKVKQELSDLRIKIRECSINPYQQSLFNQEYFQQMDQQLEKILLLD